MGPGELIILDRSGLRSRTFAPPARRAVCSFEYIYFARPDSEIGGINVHTARKRLGRQLAKEAPAEADVVTGVPDSSISAAIGYAEEAGIPYELGLIKNRYVGRTFIQPSQEMREQGVKMKLSAVRKVVEGKRVVMVDDSLVRGTTSRRIVRMLREAGAAEVHVRISSPPVRYPCFYGIDTSDPGSADRRRPFGGGDPENHRRRLPGLFERRGDAGGHRTPPGEPNRGHCLACFDGRYPTKIRGQLQLGSMEGRR